jgi:hypothetical protein
MRADLMDNCIIGKQIADDFYKQLSADILSAPALVRYGFAELWKENSEMLAKKIYTEDDAQLMSEVGIDFTLNDVYRALNAIAMDVESKQ